MIFSNISLTINISYTWENISGKEKMYKAYITLHFYSMMILTSSVDISLKGKQCQKLERRELLWQNQYTYRPKRLRTMCLFYIQCNRALRVFAINWWKVQEWLPAVIVVSHIASIFREIKHWLAGDSTVLCYQRSSFRFPNFRTGGFWSLMIPIKKIMRRRTVPICNFVKQDKFSSNNPEHKRSTRNNMKVIVLF